MRASLIHNTSRQQFIEEHSRDGGEPIELDDRTWLFSDGAVIEPGSYGNVIPPPVDPEEAARSRLRYAELRFQNAKDALIELSNELLQGAPPRGMQEELLLQLKAAKREKTAAWKAHEAALQEMEQFRDSPRQRAERRNQSLAVNGQMERQRWKERVMEVVDPQDERNDR